MSGTMSMLVQQLPHANREMPSPLVLKRMVAQRPELGGRHLFQFKLNSTLPNTTCIWLFVWRKDQVAEVFIKLLHLQGKARAEASSSCSPRFPFHSHSAGAQPLPPMVFVTL